MALGTWLLAEAAVEVLVAAGAFRASNLGSWLSAADEVLEAAGDFGRAISHNTQV
jgi:hypothetical protein